MRGSAESIVPPPSFVRKRGSSREESGAGDPRRPCSMQSGISPISPSSYLSQVFVPNIVATDKSDLAIHHHDLTMVAVVDAVVQERQHVHHGGKNISNIIPASRSSRIFQRGSLVPTPSTSRRTSTPSSRLRLSRSKNALPSLSLRMM